VAPACRFARSPRSSHWTIYPPNGANSRKSTRSTIGKLCELNRESPELFADSREHSFGSRHQHNGVADPISLSAAGVGYLTSRGIPRGCLHGDDLNERFAASTGVYCSMDECRVTAEYFRAGQFDRLIAILGPYQVFRKAFHYFENLVSPEIHAVSTRDTMFHDPVREFFAFAALAAIKNDGDGHTYDDLVATWRRERKPDACH
jgi:hypothetical protein